MTSTSTTAYLDRGDGRIAYDIAGSGPLVLCVPGMADLRSTWRHLIPALVEAGFRVASMDLRGHGDSDTTFGSYDDVAAASDIAALVEHLGGPAIVVGNSMGAAAAVIAAAQQPELIAGLALVGPFVRNPQGPAWQRLHDAGRDGRAVGTAGLDGLLPDLLPHPSGRRLHRAPGSCRRRSGPTGLPAGIPAPRRGCRTTPRRPCSTRCTPRYWW